MTAGSSCSFEQTTPASYSSRDNPFQPSISRQLSASSPATPSDTSGTRASSSLAFTPNLNLDHLELFHHWIAETCVTLADKIDRVELYKTVVVREALKFPFLMHQLLGIAALHIASSASPDVAASYYHRATELQAAAMSGFKLYETRIDEDSAFALLIFSSLVGLHVLADHSRTYDMDHDGFLHHFLHTVRLMQGVRILVVHDWWEKIRNRPEVGPFLDVVKIDPPYNNIPQPVKQLQKLVQEPTMLDEGAIAAYSTAIEHIEWMYAISGVPYKSYNTVRMIMAWPIRSTSEYLSLVDQRQPEALIILAYYAVAMHFYRESWVVRDTGARLLNAIDSNLGSHWSSWLEWPKAMVASSSSPPTARHITGADDAEMTNSLNFDI